MEIKLGNIANLLENPLQSDPAKPPNLFYHTQIQDTLAFLRLL